MYFSSDCHLCVDLVGLLRQLPVCSVNSVHRCESTRERQTWRLQPEAVEKYFRQPHIDPGKSVMRSVVISTHFLEGISKGYSNLAFALLSDFII